MNERFGSDRKYLDFFGIVNNQYNNIFTKEKDLYSK